MKGHGYPVFHAPFAEAVFIVCEQISLIKSVFHLTCDTPVFWASLTISEIITDCIFIFQGVVKKVDRVPSYPPSFSIVSEGI